MESAKLVSGIRNCQRIPHTVSEFRILSITELAHEQLKARAGVLIYSNAEFKGKVLTIVSRIHEQISKHLLTKLVDVSFYYFGNTTPNKFDFCSHWVEGVWKDNTQHIAKLGQYLGLRQSQILILEAQRRINSMFVVIGLRLYGNATHSISPI